MALATAFVGSGIIGLGRYAPERCIDNVELEARFSLEPGWIERRTGIRSRRYAADGEGVTDLAARAGAVALERSGLSRSDVALTLLATSTPDHLLPPSAPLLTRRLRLTRSGAVDVAGACAGFLYALALADGFVRTNGRPALVVAANILSRRVNPDDRTTAILFADAAGAVVVAPSADPARGALGIDLASDGSHYGLISIPAGGAQQPFGPDVPTTDTLIHITDGLAVFAAATKLMSETSRRALKRARLKLADVDRWVPHQANGRIVEAVRRTLGLPEACVVSTIGEFGNSSAATIPFSMAASGEVRPYKPGERILLTAVGAGLTAGAMVYGF